MLNHKGSTSWNIQVYKHLPSSVIGKSNLFKKTETVSVFTLESITDVILSYPGTRRKCLLLSSFLFPTHRVCVIQESRNERTSPVFPDRVDTLSVTPFLQVVSFLPSTRDTLGSLFTPRTI